MTSEPVPGLPPIPEGFVYAGLGELPGSKEYRYAQGSPIYNLDCLWTTSYPSTYSCKWTGRGHGMDSNAHYILREGSPIHTLWFALTTPEVKAPDYDF